VLTDHRPRLSPRRLVAMRRHVVLATGDAGRARPTADPQSPDHRRTVVVKKAGKSGRIGGPAEALTLYFLP